MSGREFFDAKARAESLAAALREAWDAHVESLVRILIEHDAQPTGRIGLDEFKRKPIAASKYVEVGEGWTVWGDPDCTILAHDSGDRTDWRAKPDQGSDQDRKIAMEWTDGVVRLIGDRSPDLSLD